MSEDESSQIELAQHEITVNAAAPGLIDTPMLGPEGDQRVRARFLAGTPEMFRLGVPLGKLGQRGRGLRHHLPRLRGGASHHGAILNVDGMAQLS